MPKRGMDDAGLIAAATRLAGRFSPGEDVVVASVAAALLTAAGNLYTGVSVDVACNLGFCAEHAAVAEMLKARESEIRAIVAVNGTHGILPPCGRCRELIWQVDPRNAETRVILAPDRSVPLRALLPDPWRGPARRPGRL